MINTNIRCPNPECDSVIDFSGLKEQLLDQLYKELKQVIKKI